MLLDELHNDFRPNLFVTIKFNRPESVEAIKAFTSKLTDAAWYFNRTRDRYVSGRWVLEIEKDNACHLHILVRAGVYPNTSTYLDDSHDPTNWLKKTVGKINAKVGTIAVVQYSEPIRTIEGATNYIYKLNGKGLLLFGRKLNLRLTGQFGHYFAGRTQKQIRTERLPELAFMRLEMEVDRICNPPE